MEAGQHAASGYGGPPGGNGPPGRYGPPGGYGPPGAPPGGGFPNQPPGGMPGGFGGPPPGYAVPPQYGPGPSGGMQPPAPLNTTFALVLGVFATLCACLPGGIIAINFANQAKTLAAQGNYDQARSKLTTSYIISAVSIFLGVPLSLLFIAAKLAH